VRATAHGSAFHLVALIEVDGRLSISAVGYVNLVEQPARLSCGVQLAVTEWRPSYKRGTLMQGPLALIGSLSALVSWWFDGGRAWLVGGLLLLLAIPFTLVVIVPTNKRLESQELDLRSQEAERLLRRWGRLDEVRSLPSGAAFIVFLISLSRPR
jgi:uncharacterized membrane protein